MVKLIKLPFRLIIWAFSWILLFVAFGFVGVAYCIAWLLKDDNEPKPYYDSQLL